MTIKKLIEVALPLDIINKESAREKSIRHGHPSTLHLWWARRPLATTRCIIWASLVDDPSSHPEIFTTEKEQDIERNRLFEILKKLASWDNINDRQLYEEAEKEIRRWTRDEIPDLLDPFAGGGAIPLEGQRLGLNVYAQDLNPVAVMINKSMLEIPQIFNGKKAINPNASMHFDIEQTWDYLNGLAEDVEYYANIIKRQAFEKLKENYPILKNGNNENTVSSWIWARTVTCPNPACQCKAPLIKSRVLSKKAVISLSVLLMRLLIQ